jgi:uncharacterized coiled-coil DUF342 family protein
MKRDEEKKEFEMNSRTNIVSICIAIAVLCSCAAAKKLQTKETEVIALQERNDKLEKYAEALRLQNSDIASKYDLLKHEFNNYRVDCEGSRKVLSDLRQELAVGAGTSDPVAQNSKKYEIKDPDN